MCEQVDLTRIGNNHIWNIISTAASGATILVKTRRFNNPAIHNSSLIRHNCETRAAVAVELYFFVGAQICGRTNG
jgi:hypothetical protein